MARINLRMNPRSSTEKASKPILTLRMSPRPSVQKPKATRLVLRGPHPITKNIDAMADVSHDQKAEPSDEDNYIVPIAEQWMMANKVAEAARQNARERLGDAFDEIHRALEPSIDDPGNFYCHSFYTSAPEHSWIEIPASISVPRETVKETRKQQGKTLYTTPSLNTIIKQESDDDNEPTILKPRKAINKSIDPLQNSAQGTLKYLEGKLITNIDLYAIENTLQKFYLDESSAIIDMEEPYQSSLDTLRDIEWQLISALHTKRMRRRSSGNWGSRLRPRNPKYLTNGWINLE